MKISVIIPMYNARKTIRMTLEGLKQQTLKDFEIVVVDDGSTDGSAQVIQDFATQNSLSVKVVQQVNSGAGKARNAGVQNSSGDIVVFVDSDCIPPSNWLEAMTRPIKDDMAGCTCGYKVKNRESITARYVDYEIARRHRKLVGKTTNAVGSYSLSLLKEAFRKVGGFDTSYTSADAEDFDLAFRLNRAGYNIFFTGDTFVYHFHPAYLKKYFVVGRHGNDDSCPVKLIHTIHFIYFLDLFQIV